MDSTVEVVAPARLHFGLWSLGCPPEAGPDARQFGGVGVMICHPAVRLRIEPAGQWTVQGQQTQRVETFAQRWAAYYGRRLPDCRVTLCEAPPPHAGLGSGTQLALSVAAGLSRFCQMPMPHLSELARSVGRARRSAVGTYGFALGGLIVERGKAPHELLSPLEYRVVLPPAWHFVLVRPLGMEGLAGSQEADALAQLPPVPPRVTQELIDRVRHEMVPAALCGDFATFSESVYAYGRQAGTCFAPLQGGPYNGSVLTALVERLRHLGIRGVGQSSWGPTVYALTASRDEAERLASQLTHLSDLPPLEVQVTHPASRGASLRPLPIWEPAPAGGD
jgi:beta-ribofuranosylaminobenzene 5'-phosphate synthase